ncbi:MAG: hypothetical protein H7Y04_13925 [Verrucomicrobia bacterium]|nr:hypothetical protein [Cytophagales bacterium]
MNEWLIELATLKFFLTEPIYVFEDENSEGAFLEEVVQEEARKPEKLLWQEEILVLIPENELNTQEKEQLQRIMQWAGIAEKCILSAMHLPEYDLWASEKLKKCVSFGVALPEKIFSRETYKIQTSAQVSFLFSDTLQVLATNAEIRRKLLNPLGDLLEKNKS